MGCGCTCIASSLVGVMMRIRVTLTRDGRKRSLSRIGKKKAAVLPETVKSETGKDKKRLPKNSNILF